MIIECIECGQRMNLSNGDNMGWLEIVVNAKINLTTDRAETKLIIKCKSCGHEIEY